ncbi:hypothetical protein GFM09_37480 [Rhizobium leguminosarum bv. viciae]|uniref:hypothetical protein n=1 Tax=Rhizobium leguminosarum TaxID=384 RepID=UPI001441E1B7|nr:hypothetical protein [Rhizobium leguminosarum]NKL74802.1 hypothetical protein [Rhizobium leguminosarum bv. viciae]
MLSSLNIWILVLLCAGYLVAAIDISRGRKRLAVFELVALTVLVAVLKITTEFPFPQTRQSFGAEISVWWALIAMSLGVIMGMAANYVWSRPKRFTLLDFLRPIVVSPIVLLPLIGSLDATSLAPIQLASLSLLAFQNGFFWQQVLNNAPQTATG